MKDEYDTPTDVWSWKINSNKKLRLGESGTPPHFIQPRDAITNGFLENLISKFPKTMKIHRCLNCFGILGNHSTDDCPELKWTR